MLNTGVKKRLRKKTICMSVNLDILTTLLNSISELTIAALTNKIYIYSIVEGLDSFDINSKNKYMEITLNFRKNLVLILSIMENINVDVDHIDIDNIEIIPIGTILNISFSTYTDIERQPFKFIISGLINKTNIIPFTRIK
jgi:hypothetical protein